MRIPSRSVALCLLGPRWRTIAVIGYAIMTRDSTVNVAPDFARSTPFTGKKGSSFPLQYTGRFH